MIEKNWCEREKNVLRVHSRFWENKVERLEEISLYLLNSLKDFRV